MKTISVLCFTLFLVFTACNSSSKLSYSWKADTVTTNSYNKIMVVGMIQTHDQSLREKMENHLVGDLTEHGYTAVSSLKEYGPKSFENMKDADAIAKLRNSGVSAVITIVLLDKQREREYVPERVHYSPYTIYHENFWGYYSTLNDRIYTPGYYQVNTRYFWESNFYEMAGNKLVYSSQTKSFNPNSSEALAHEYGKMIVTDMASKGVIK